MREIVGNLIGSPRGRLDPQEMIAKMVEVIPQSEGHFRNVFPAFVEKSLREHQADMFDLRI